MKVLKMKMLLLACMRFMSSNNNVALYNSSIVLIKIISCKRAS